jgi:hypothetical protein
MLKLEPGGRRVMAGPSIKCPNCQTEIPLDEALLSPVEDRVRKQYTAEIAKLNAKLKGVEKEAAAKAEKEAREALKEERAEIERKARDGVAVELESLRQQTVEQAEKAKAAQQKELELLKKLRAAEKSEAERALEQERQLDTERAKIADEVQKTLGQTWELQKKQYEKTIADLGTKIEDLNQRATLTSQQLQGEVQEERLEEILKETFQSDRFEPVKSGAEGGDVLQIVMTARGLEAGRVLWESKRTKNWSNAWVDKLKRDQREAKADAAVIATRAMPAGVDGFGLVDSVAVVDFRRILPVASMLRQHLLDLSRSKSHEIDRASKQEVVYQYLASTGFRQSLQAVAEAFVHSEQDLRREQVALTKIWKRREEHLNRGLVTLAEMYGSLQDRMGPALPDIGPLALPVADDVAAGGELPDGGGPEAERKPKK